MENIIALAKSKEWDEFVAYIRKRIQDIKIDRDLPVDEVGKRALAKIILQEEFNIIINDIERMKNQKKRENIVYK